MKKLVLATTLIAAAIGAQAQTAVYGAVNQVLGTTTSGGMSTTGLANDGSRIGIKATESLKGMTARAVVETDVDGAAAFGNRQLTVGLSSAMGSVDLGRAQHGAYKTIAAADPFGDSYGSVVGAIHNTRGTRLSNAVFVTAAPIAGVALSLDRGTAAGSNPYSVSAQTTVMGLGVGAAYYSDANASTQVVSAAKTLKSGTQVAVSHSRNDDSGVKTQGTLFGVTQPLSSALTARASWGTASNDVTAYNFGVAYALSKRTQVTATYSKVDAVADVSAFGVGIYHSF